MDLTLEDTFVGLWPWNEKDHNMFIKILYFLRPNFYKILVLVILVLITMLTIVSRVPTSKVSWDQIRGAPFPSFVLTEYRGPCPPLNTFCVRYYFQEIYLVELLINILIWYIASCVLFMIYNIIGGRSRVNESGL